MLPELLVDAKGPDGCFWPEADLPATPGDVCFPVKCGLNILAASISGFDPKPTFRAEGGHSRDILRRRKRRSRFSRGCSVIPPALSRRARQEGCRLVVEAG